MSIPLLIFVGIIFFIIHLSLWQILPIAFREICLANPVFAFIIDLAGSELITAFTGVASFVGMANMTASVFFGLYAVWYVKHEHITGLGIGWCKLFNVIPVFPKLIVLRDNSR